LVVHDENDGDITLTGFVYGDTYAADEREEENGETNIVYTIFALSENTSGSGNVSIIWFDNDDYCEMGFDISLVKPSTGGDGGGGGGGCFIEALIH